MRVIYAGGPTCSETTFKRLLVLANEIGFSDRPSIRFDNVSGAVGVPTPFRAFPHAMPKPLDLVVHEPPGGRIEDIYAPFVAADSRNPEARRIFLDGLANEAFQNRYVGTDARYGDSTGAEIVAALLSDQTMVDADLGEVRGLDDAYNVSTKEGRRDTLRVLLAEASIHVTTAMLGAEEFDLVPVTDDPFLARLITLRVGGEDARRTHATVELGYEIVRGVIPDEALQRLEIPDLLEFRGKTTDVYSAWGKEVERLRATLDEQSMEGLPERARRLVASDVVPKMNAFRAELKSARDALFGDLIKSVVDWKWPALGIALLQHSSLLVAALGVLGGAAAASAKAAIDFQVKRRGALRSNGVAYLVELADRASDE